MTVVIAAAAGGLAVTGATYGDDIRQFAADAFGNGYRLSTDFVYIEEGVADSLLIHKQAERTLRVNCEADTPDEALNYQLYSNDISDYGSPQIVIYKGREANVGICRDNFLGKSELDELETFVRSDVLQDIDPGY